MGRILKNAALTALTFGSLQAAPALAQEAAEASAEGEAIIVTAQRMEQRLQDVPISITVLDQTQLENNNITNMKDLAGITPGLSLNSRFGSDATTFSIRGFSQEIRTYSTVGTYFADVVAPRGSGHQGGGDGAGPGALFDLQNVQVLKGPQGTLFGRNTSGGAVLLVPRRPTDRLEGYVEGSVGDYAMRRFQGVINLPLADTFRVRLGVDRMKRDGYLINIGNLGDGRYGQDLGDVDYVAGRLSILAELTPELENYTVATLSHSQNNGVLPKIFRCYPGAVANISTRPADAIPFGNMACAQKAREDAAGEWTVSNRLGTSNALSKQWQVINTTTWNASEAITAKAILAYGEYRNRSDSDFFGGYFLPAGITPGTETAGQVTGYAMTIAEPFSGWTNAQSSFVAELQLQGHANGGPFSWQAGLYAELNDPLGFSGIQSATFTACADLATLNCAPLTPGFSLGSVAVQAFKSRFRDYAVYGQGSYDLSDKLKLTAGLRYTWDRQIGEIHNEQVGLAARTITCRNLTAPEFGRTFPQDQRFTACRQIISKSTSAPTWLVNLEYRPVDDLMTYAKYSRGYRQGGLALGGPDPLQAFDAETVDVYEVGLKTNWRGAVPGHLYLSGYYNAFHDQQLLLGVLCDPSRAPFQSCSPTISIVNAGQSRMYGLEAELGLRPFRGFNLNVSYAYLNTKLQKFTPPTLPATSPYNVVRPPVVGDVIPNSQPHKLTVAANYELPLPDAIGRISVGGTFTYTARYRVVADVIAGSRNGFIPAARVLNLNVNWEGIGGLPADLSFFMSNVTNEKVYTTLTDNQDRGFVSGVLAEPRMWGLRLKYRFGD